MSLPICFHKYIKSTMYKMYIHLHMLLFIPTCAISKHTDIAVNHVFITTTIIPTEMWSMELMVITCWRPDTCRHIYGLSNSYLHQRMDTSIYYDMQLKLISFVIMTTRVTKHLSMLNHHHIYIWKTWILHVTNVKI